MAEALPFAALVGTAATPFGYVVGRLATDTYFGRFGVSPEEVGISQLTLVLSSALAAVLLFCFVVIATVVGNAFRRGGVGLIAVALVLMLMGLGISWRGFLWGLLIAAGFELLEGESTIALSPAGYRRVVAVGVASVGLAVATLAIVEANWRADDALAGRAAQVSLGPVRIQGVRAQPVIVEVVGRPPGLTTLDGHCALLLGASDDTVVLLTAHTVWRAPAVDLVLVATDNDCH